MLAEPVSAMTAWSHDPSLQTTAPLISGKLITAVEWQRRFWDAFSRFVDTGACDIAIPRVREIVALYQDTLEKLAQGRFDQLAGRLDWVLKRAILEQAQQAHGLAWTSPEIKLLDQRYSDLDPEAGLFWAYDRAGVVEHVVAPADILRREFAPPENTRAWTRAQLLGLARPSQIQSIDWDRLRFCLGPDQQGEFCQVDVHLDNPLGFTKEETSLAFTHNALGKALASLARLTCLDGRTPVVEVTPGVPPVNTNLVIIKK